MTKFFPLRHLRLTAGAALLSCALLSTAQAAKPNPPNPVCIDGDCITQPKSDGSAKKWHPGHYVWVGELRLQDAANQDQVLAFIDSIASESSIKGIQLIAYWSALEGATAGDYSQGFVIIDKILNRLSRNGKKLMLSVQERTFGASGSDYSRYFPTYIVNGSQYGITKTTVGLAARVWQTPTTDRIIALSKAYAERYDSHPAFEMLTLAETAVNLAQGTDGFSNSALSTQIKRVLDAASKQWPKTTVRLNANWIGSDDLMQDLVNYGVARNIAIGGPDVLPNEDISANRVFAGTVKGNDYRGKSVWISEVQSPELGGKEGTFTPEQLYNHALKGGGESNAVSQHPQYFIWYKNDWAGGTAQQWKDGILPFIRSTKGAVASTTCPPLYSMGCNSAD